MSGSGVAATVLDGARLCLGTLTPLPVTPPRRVDRPRAATAMVLAPVAGAAVGVVSAAALLAAGGAALPLPLAAILAVGAGAAATRFLHLDGLADTADGWAAAAHGERERALAVMRRGDVGPVGATVLLLVLGVQVAAVAAVADRHGALQAATAVLWAVATSRAVLPVLCSDRYRPARPDGLGAAVVGTVPWPVAAVPAVGLTAAVGFVLGAGAALASAAALAVAVAVVTVAGRRLGGLTGDLLGAGVEVALAALLVVTASALLWPVT